MNRSKFAPLVLAVALAALVPSDQPSAYTLKTAKWDTMAVPYYVNPGNFDVSPQAAVDAMQIGAQGWTAQSRTPFRFTFAGLTASTTAGNNGRNEVFFRNASSGSAVATTYSWYSGSRMLDADIVFWDAAFAFFTGTAGCNGGLYVEDIATHEFGHALGLGHSAVADATMYPSVSYCGTQTRSLAADDVAGVEALYPPSGGTTPTNNLPSVGITSPASGSSYANGASITFSGFAQDTEDGVLTSAIRWSSSLSGAFGTGGSLTAVLPAGSHRITASVSDRAGATRSASVDITVQAAATVPTTSGPVLTGKGRKVKGVQHADLNWTGISSASVVVMRGGAAVITTANDGAHTDAIGAKGGGTVVYRVCEAGTSVCSNQVTVSF